ncbi:DNA gyrase inhibitor YacG [Zophobihabitans entericus]|uniref:DNA gyrase inhibitor YacG n=1 Tax=Zophobihabitans entericus TaxID=1635327 RepID=A0A6G9IC92_9GAMM|nr:DNA gyrase inhibitor YacG [Zophobihabitans entericus]QIQ21833.1 DNA gyrase inhibitor YacG [Zophobihabitans entericus]
MSNDEIVYVNCPTCQKRVEWNEKNPFRPFCSKRCQLIDLGDWANEENKIPSNEAVTDSELWSDEILSQIDRDEK